MSTNWAADARRWPARRCSVRLTFRGGHEYPDQGPGLDPGEQRQLVIVVTVRVFGIGGTVVGQGETSLQGVALSGFAAIILNLILPHTVLGEDHSGADKGPPSDGVPECRYCKDRSSC